MRIVSVVGARPQFVKLAPVCRAIDAHNSASGQPIEHLVIHTGQHYDQDLSDIFFDELEIPKPDVNLEVGSGSHGQQTGQMLSSFERQLLDLRPDAVIVYGDTNSTLAGALAAVKLHIPVAHVEAGLRSFNRMMPEEINRIATDHVADLLFAPTRTAMQLLGREGLGQRAILTGDVGFDAVLFNSERARERSQILRQLKLQPGAYAVMTVHRAENTDRDKLANLLDGLGGDESADMPIVTPVHPRTARLLPPDAMNLNPYPGIRLIKPVGFLDMLQLVQNARMVLTDSGGLQKEAYFLGTPCITLREQTEWTETIEAGANLLTGLDQVKIRASINHWKDTDPGGALRGVSCSPSHPFGQGDAAHRVVRELISYLGAAPGRRQ